MEELELAAGRSLWRIARASQSAAPALGRGALWKGPATFIPRPLKRNSLVSGEVKTGSPWRRAAGYADPVCF